MAYLGEDEGVNNYVTGIYGPLIRDFFNSPLGAEARNILGLRDATGAAFRISFPTRPPGQCQAMTVRLVGAQAGAASVLVNGLTVRLGSHKVTHFPVMRPSRDASCWQMSVFFKANQRCVATLV